MTIATRFWRRRGQRRLACAMRGARCARASRDGLKSSALYAVPSPSLLYSPGRGLSVAAFSLLYISTRLGCLNRFVTMRAWVCTEPGAMLILCDRASARGVESTQRIARPPVATHA